MPLLPSPSDRSKASSRKVLQKHRRDENSTEDAERPINPDHADDGQKSQRGDRSRGGSIETDPSGVLLG